MKSTYALRPMYVGLALATLLCGLGVADASAGAPLDQRSAPPAAPATDVTAKSKSKSIPVVMPAAAVPARDEFRWRGKIGAGGLVEILSLAGEVTIETSKGNDLEVVAIPRNVDGAAERVSIEVIEHARGVTVCAVMTDFEALGDGRCRPGATEEAASKPAPQVSPVGRLASSGARVDYILRVPSGVRVSSQNAQGEVKHHQPSGGEALNLARIPRESQPCPGTRRY